MRNHLLPSFPHKDHRICNQHQHQQIQGDDEAPGKHNRGSAKSFSLLQAHHQVVEPPREMSKSGQIGAFFHSHFSQGVLWAVKVLPEGTCPSWVSQTLSGTTSTISSQIIFKRVCAITSGTTSTTSSLIIFKRSPGKSGLCNNIKDYLNYLLGILKI